MQSVTIEGIMQWRAEPGRLCFVADSSHFMPTQLYCQLYTGYHHLFLLLEIQMMICWVCRFIKRWVCRFITVGCRFIKWNSWNIVLCTPWVSCPRKKKFYKAKKDKVGFHFFPKKCFSLVGFSFALLSEKLSRAVCRLE